MTYTIENKNGFTPQSMQGIQTHAAVMCIIQSFMAWNKPRKALTTDADKIAYYNRRSFYTVKAMN